ncbi:MAG: Acyl-CoA dehydrogenase [Pseudomonadota bacterium]
MEEGRGVKLLAARMLKTAQKAQALPDLAEDAKALTTALQKVTQATQMAWSTGQPQEALANAVPYLQAFGHLVLAWIWLDVSASCRGEASPKQTGRQAAAKYFYRYELPKIDAWLNVVGGRDMTCANLSEEAF